MPSWTNARPNWPARSTPLSEERNPRKMKTDKVGQILHEARDMGELGDFTATRRLIPISLLAIVIGIVSSFVAWALLRLINLFTNLFYFQHWSVQPASPAGNHLGLFAILV